jgi:hypothetical protein
MLCKKFVYPTFSYKGSFALFDVVVGQSEPFFGEECLDGNPRDGFGAVGVNSRSVRESCGRKLIWRKVIHKGLVVGGIFVSLHIEKMFEVANCGLKQTMIWQICKYNIYDYRETKIHDVHPC